MPASRRARAMIFAPRSCPSRPGFAMTTLILRATALRLQPPEVLRTSGGETGQARQARVSRSAFAGVLPRPTAAVGAAEPRLGRTIRIVHLTMRRTRGFAAPQITFAEGITPDIRQGHARRRRA